MAKRRWDSSNPLYRWIHRHKGKSKDKAYKPPKTHRSSVRHMARRRSRRSRVKSFLNMRTIFNFIKVGAFVAPAFERYDIYKNGTLGDKFCGIFGAYGGYEVGTKAWDWNLLAKMWTPYISTTLVTTGVQKLNGIIRRL